MWYSQTIEATGTQPITFAITGGTLPPGLTLDPETGVISGTPTTGGSFTFTVTATNDAGTGAREYTVVITPPTTPPVIEPTTPPVIQPPHPGDGGSGSLATTGASPPMPLIIGALIALTLGAAGVIQGARLRRERY